MRNVSKCSGVRFGLAVVLALGWLALIDAAALAQSDSIQVGTLPPETLTESQEMNGVNTIGGAVDFFSTQGITGTMEIGLTDPGTSNISDLVSASIIMNNPA